MRGKKKENNKKNARKYKKNLKKMNLNKREKMNKIKLDSRICSLNKGFAK